MNKTLRVLTCVLVFLFGLASIAAARGDREDYNNQGNLLRVTAGFEYNNWYPYQSDYLDYEIEGIKVAYADIALFPGFRLLPNLTFHIETNFNADHQGELMQRRDQSTKIEQAYNKYRFIGGFFRNDAGRNTMEVEYTKETFYISVTPRVSNLYYAPYDSDTVQQFNIGDNVSQYVDFEEINVTFDTYGISILIGLINALTTGGTAQIYDLSGVADTRFGIFYAQFHKPYEIDMVSGGSGYTTGERFTIYNARFRTIGLIEKIQTRPYSIVIFNYIPRFGLTFIDLREGEELRDVDTPLFFYYGHEFQLGLRVGSRDFAGRIVASVDFTFMYGGTMKNNEETGNAQIETRSFINNDVLVKFYGVFEFSI